MANNTIDALIEERIDIFRSAFAQRAKVLFHDETKQNKLRHTGEFGTYREGIVRDFLQSFLPQQLAIDTGFVVNALGEVSGQIDLVIYNPSLTPPLESKNRQRFFPIETVIAAGEVKSNVSRDEFEDGLIRLAKIKQMRSALPADASAAVRWYRLKDVDYNPDRIPFDQVFTFLICNSINFCWRNTFVSILDDIYKSIDYAYRHSSMLSIEDGLLFYIDPDNENCAYPISLTGKENNRNFWIHSSDNKYDHFKRFCSNLFMHAAHCTVGYVNLLKYANFGEDKINYWVEEPKSGK